MEPSDRAATPDAFGDGSDTSETDEKCNADHRRKHSNSLEKDMTKTRPANSHNGTGESKKPVLECSVCLQTCQLPVQLPCRHIFCFLCVKGVANRSRGCALCRQPIPPDFLCKPNLLCQEELDNTVTFDNGYSWFYEGSDGWWQYDDRTSRELESHHKAGRSSCELLIAGFVYVIDLTNMVQCRRNDRTKKRRVKRDLVTIRGRKGIAGLKIVTENVVTINDRPGADGHETSTASARQSIPIQNGNRSGDPSCSPPTPHNTPQTPMTPSESPPTNGPTESDLSGTFSHLRLTDSFTPSPASPQEGLVASSLSFDSPDVARMEDVRASLQQLQSVTNGHDLLDAGEEGENFPDGDLCD